MSQAARMWKGAGLATLGGVLLSGVLARGDDGPPLASQLSELGRQALAQGANSMARSFFQKALQLDPGNAQAQRGLKQAEAATRPGAPRRGARFGNLFATGRDSAACFSDPATLFHDPATCFDDPAACFLDPASCFDDPAPCFDDPAGSPGCWYSRRGHRTYSNRSEPRGHRQQHTLSRHSDRSSPHRCSDESASHGPRVACHARGERSDRQHRA